MDADLTGEALLGPRERRIALRIVQEALTNVLRHAPGSRATVAIRAGDDAVEIRIVNSAPAGPGTGA